MRPRPCPTCGIEATKTLGWRGGEHHRYGMGVATRIVQCGQCSLIFPNPFPVPKKPTELYGDPAKYFANADEDGKTQRFRKHIREACEKVGMKTPSLLDVGSGRGEMLRAAKLEGLERVVGLELSTSMIDHVRDKYGITVIPKILEDYAASETQPFDVVMLAAILEHVYDPSSMIAAAAKLTRPGSVLYIDVPCEPSLVTMVGNAINKLRRKPAVFNLSPTWPPYHVFGFNPKALETLLRKHGFKLEQLDIWADPHIPSQPNLKDRVMAAVGTQVNKLANVLKKSSNMSGWARRV